MSVARVEVRVAPDALRFTALVEAVTKAFEGLAVVARRAAQQFGWFAKAAAPTQAQAAVATVRYAARVGARAEYDRALREFRAGTTQEEMLGYVRGGLSFSDAVAIEQARQVLDPGWAFATRHTPAQAAMVAVAILAGRADMKEGGR